MQLKKLKSRYLKLTSEGILGIPEFTQSPPNYAVFTRFYFHPKNRVNWVIMRAQGRRAPGKNGGNTIVLLLLALQHQFWAGWVQTKAVLFWHILLFIPIFRHT